MSMLDLRTASLNDMVFEGRNKLYGAYVLRQLYERHLARALAVAITLSLLLVSSPLIKAWLFPQMIISPPVTDLPIPVIEILPPPVFEDPKPATSQAKVAPAVIVPPAEVAPRVVPDDKVKVEEPVKPTITAVEPVVDVISGKEGGVGSDATGTIGKVGTGKSDSGSTATNTAPATIFFSAEVMPEFMGGQEALQRYMQKNLRYPSMALRNNIEGRVYISFTVQADGSIADVEVLKGLGYGTDEEAARVVKKMPSWKPGMQNKHSVAVRYTMPITFRYE